MNDVPAAGFAAEWDVPRWLTSPAIWGLMVGALGLWIILSSRSQSRRRSGRLVAGAGLILLLASLPKLSSLSTWSEWVEQALFWIFAAVAVGCAAVAISVRNPVYTAIWFAGSLLGVSGLFLFQHAQFLGVANIVVYAGAIVVIFLFVLMLANPEGHARYDQISWSPSVIPLALLIGATLVGIVMQSFVAPPAPATAGGTVLADDHMVQLGTELFARHLVAVEVAGTLLLVALVGAVAIVIQGRDRRPAAARPPREAAEWRGARP